MRRWRGTQRLALSAPPLNRSEPSPALLAQLAQALGLQPAQVIAAQLLDNGPVWLGLLLDSPETVLQLTPSYQALEKLDVKVGVAFRERVCGGEPDAARCSGDERDATGEINRRLRIPAEERASGRETDAPEAADDTGCERGVGQPGRGRKRGRGGTGGEPR